MTEIIGKEVDLKLVERDQLSDYFKQLVPEEHVQELVEMTSAVLPGGIISGDCGYDENPVRVRVELVDTLRQAYTKSRGS